MTRIFAVTCAALLITVTACAPKQNQTHYKEGEVGLSRAVEFGTVLNKREVEIDTRNSGLGTVGGAGAGALAGSYMGDGTGTIWTTVGGTVVGAVAGYYGEQALYDRKGNEYVVQLQSGETKTIVQEIGEKDQPIEVGSYVMLQYCDAGEKAKRCKPENDQYERLFPVKKLPPYVKKKKKVVNTSETGAYVDDDAPPQAKPDFDLFR